MWLRKNVRTQKQSICLIDGCAKCWQTFYRSQTDPWWMERMVQIHLPIRYKYRERYKYKYKEQLSRYKNKENQKNGMVDGCFKRCSQILSNVYGLNFSGNRAWIWCHIFCIFEHLFRQLIGSLCQNLQYFLKIYECHMVYMSLFGLYQPFI